MSPRNAGTSVSGAHSSASARSLCAFFAASQARAGFGSRRPQSRSESAGVVTPQHGTCQNRRARAVEPRRAALSRPRRCAQASSHLDLERQPPRGHRRVGAAPAETQEAKLTTPAMADLDQHRQAHRLAARATGSTGLPVESARVGGHRNSGKPLSRISLQLGPRRRSPSISSVVRPPSAASSSSADLSGPPLRSSARISAAIFATCSPR